MKTQVKPALPLEEAPFFREVSSRLRARIENYVYHREYEPRQIVFFPDDPCDRVYWVHRGRVKIATVRSDRRELTYRYLLAGDMFGEECLIKSAKRDAYAEAVEPSVLCLMSAADFRRIVRDEKEISLMVAKWLCRRVGDVEETLAECVFKSVRSRVASGLLRLHQRAPQKENGRIRITHQEIASLVGSTRETTTAVLHRLQREGMVAIGNRHVTLLDPVALQRVARSG